MKTCPKCNFVIDNDNAKFCKKCGHPLPLPVSTGAGSTPASVMAGSGILLKNDHDISPSIQERKETARRVVFEQHNAKDIGRNTETKKNMIWAVKTCFRKYATFKGRATRSEYWYFVLFNMLVLYIPLLLASLLNHYIISSILVIAAGLYLFASIIPGLSVAVRRLHDSGKSGYNYLILLIPFIGSFILLYFMCKRSDKGENIYG